MPDPYDLALSHIWAGSMIEPLTPAGADWCATALVEHWSDDQAAYLFDERDAMEIAHDAREAGLTFARMESLDGPYDA